MMLFVTADEIGIQTGGGIVTQHECQALFNLAASRNQNAQAIQRTTLNTYSKPDQQEPWKWDECCLAKLKLMQAIGKLKDLKLAHFYSGTFSRTVQYLKDLGCKVSYTIAAHDRMISHREHRRWGMDFPYKHLTDSALWSRYIEGYRLADVIICPGSVPKKTVQEYGPDFANKRIEIIPHGCELPEVIKPIPKSFVVGYCGSVAPDKGTIYLLQAWKRLAYTDSVLILAGRDSGQPWMTEFVSRYGGGNIILAGWQRNMSDFYNQLSLYIQPSATEGFGLEVLEAMAHGRLVLCSTGAGAVDLVPVGRVVDSCSIDKLCEKINAVKQCNRNQFEALSLAVRDDAANYTWDKVRQMYMRLWKDMIL